MFKKTASASKAANGTITVEAKANAPKIYDALGGETTLKTGNITALDDLIERLSLHVGADATENNQITINLESMSAKGLG